MAEPTILIYVLLGVSLLVSIWILVLFNNLVRYRNHCEEAWSNIDSELKRRYDLIPNLVSTVKGYAAHENDVLERVTQARHNAMAGHGSLGDKASDENALVGSLRHLFAVSEGYPDLKASQNFLHLQQELINTEDRIQRARRFYNANVRDLNTRIQEFPSSLVASMFHFQRMDFFEIEDSSMRQAPTVQL